MAKREQVWLDATVGELVEDSQSICEELAGELEDWYNNLPDAFQNGEKGDRLQEAIDVLQGIDWPEVPESVKDTKVRYLQGKRPKSRRDRANEASMYLGLVADEARKAADDYDGDHEDVDTDEIRSFADDVENAMGAVDEVEFPGMYS